MSLFGWLRGGLGTATASASSGPSEEDAHRLGEWETALNADRLPGFVTERLRAAGEGRTPWLSTMTPSELSLARSHGIRPIATVSGTCWFHYGYSWTKGHAAGWRSALERLKREAIAAGANAVVDVKMRQVRLSIESSMDYTLVGTAVRIDGLPPSADPVVATVSALEFVRLLEAGIVPVGIAIGAHYDWLQSNSSSIDGETSWKNRPLTRLGNFWERARRQAHAELRADTARQGTGVLAHTHFGQILRFEDKETKRFLGRHIVIGTVVESRPGSPVPHSIEMVLDMRDDLSPLTDAAPHGHNAYDTDEEEGAI